MAYNFYPQYYPQYPQNRVEQNPLQAQPQIQNGGFIPVRNENEARSYPVAFGNSVTFKDESAPYIYTKTMGFSQLDTPKFEKYRLVKEEAQISSESEETTETNKVLGNEIKARFDAVWGEIEALKSEVGTLRSEMGDKSEKKIKKGAVKDDADSESK